MMVRNIASKGCAIGSVSALLGALLISQGRLEGAVIYSDANDGFLEVRDSLPPQDPWPNVHPDTFGSWNANVGEWFGQGLTTIVLPFELPNFGAVSDPFLSANLGVQLYQMGSSTFTNVDLYAVRVDADPAISVSDWYNGSTPDPNATLIQAGFLTPSSPGGGGGEGVPNNFTNAAGDAALLSYLNDAYADGANAGKFVFLRLSYAADGLAVGWDAYKITTRESGGDGENPVITYTTNAVSGDTNNNGIIEFEPDFGPIRDNWLETNESFGATLSRTDGDLNLDGVVGIADFREWKDACLNAGCALPEDISAAFASLEIPEPMSVGLVAMAVVALVVRRDLQS